MRVIILFFLLIVVSCTSNSQKSAIEILEIGENEWMIMNLSKVDSLGNKIDFFTYKEALNACPEGWHLPTINEWNNLKNNLKQIDVDLFFSSYKGIKINDTTTSFAGKVTYYWAQSSEPHTYFFKSQSDSLLRFSSFDENYSLCGRCVKD